jgi:hypothetical protein
VNRVADEAISRVAENDLARLGRLLQSGGDVDGVARRERLPLRRVTGDDLARVDPCADLELHTALVLELRV